MVSAKCWGQMIRLSSVEEFEGQVPTMKRHRKSTWRNGITGAYLFWGRKASAAGNYEALQISANGKHTCALMENRQVKCWGDNISVQAGLETPVNALGF